MCITIKPVVQELLQRRHNLQIKIWSAMRMKDQKGFTLPEVLVSLCILLLLLSAVWQWGIVMQRSVDHMEENQCAVYLAQQIIAGITPQYPLDWAVKVDYDSGHVLCNGAIITVVSPSRQWEFYYAGKEQ